MWNRSAVLLTLVLAGCAGTAMTVTQPTGMPGLFALNDLQVAALAATAAPAPYVELSVTINPRTPQGFFDGLVLGVGGDRVKRLRLLCDFDGDKHIIDFYGADGKVVGVTADKDEGPDSKDGKAKVIDGKIGVPILRPQAVTRHLSIEGELTVYDSRALSAFRELASITGDIGSSVTSGVMSDEVKKTTDKIASSPGQSTRPVNLYFGSPAECRTAAKKCDAFLVDQSIVVVDVPSDWTVQKAANSLRLEGGRLFDVREGGNKLFGGGSIIISMRLHRLPSEFFSTDCARLLAAHDAVDVDDLKKSCSTESLTPEDATRFARLRDAWGRALAKADDREVVAARAVELIDALKDCGSQPRQLPDDSLLCRAAADQLARLQVQVPHPELLNARLDRYQKMLAPLAALPTSGLEACDALRTHAATEARALQTLQAEPLEGCEFGANTDSPIRCVDLKTTVEEARKARQRRDRLTDACIQQRFIACGQGATDHLRSICVSLAQIDPDTPPSQLHVDADLEHPVPADSTPQIMAALNDRIDLGGKLPRTLRTERLLQLAEAQLNTMTLDAEAARVAVRMFRERTELDALAEQAKRIEQELRKTGRLPPHAASTFAMAARLSRTGLSDLFAVQGAAFKVKGDWQALAERIDVTTKAVNSMWEESHPPVFVSPPVTASTTPAAAPAPKPEEHR